MPYFMSAALPLMNITSFSSRVRMMCLAMVVLPLPPCLSTNQWICLGCGLLWMISITSCCHGYSSSPSSGDFFVAIVVAFGIATPLAYTLPVLVSFLEQYLVLAIQLLHTVQCALGLIRFIAISDLALANRHTPWRWGVPDSPISSWNTYCSKSVPSVSISETLWLLMVKHHARALDPSFSSITGSKPGVSDCVWVCLSVSDISYTRLGEILVESN